MHWGTDGLILWQIDHLELIRTSHLILTIGAWPFINLVDGVHSLSVVSANWDEALRLNSKLSRVSINIRQSFVF